MSGPAPGLDYHNPSLSTDKIDHLLSPAPGPAAVQLERSPVPSGHQHRYSYDLKPSSVNVPTSNPQWRPVALSTPFIAANVGILVFWAAMVELLYWTNENAQGLVPSHYVKHHLSFVPYLTVLPAILALLIVLPWFEVDRLIKLVQPYVSMSQSRSLAGPSVLLNYNSRPSLFALPQLIRNQHVTPLLTTCITIFALLVVPFGAAFIRLGPVPEGVFIGLGGITQVDQLTVPSTLPFAQLNSAASFANAASVYGMVPPQLTMFNGAISWTAAGVDHSKFEYDGIVMANTVVLQSYADCQTTTDASFSDSVLTGDAFGCSYHINITKSSGVYYESTYSDSSSFGVQPCGSDSSPNSVAPVVFWDVYISNGESIALATTCRPNVYAYRADVYYNSSNSMLVGVQNLQPVKSEDLAGLNGIVSGGQLTVSNSTLNGTALNGLFLNYVADTDVPVLTSIQQTMSYAVDTAFRNNLASQQAFGFIGAHVDAALVAYGNFLGVAARALYYTDVSSDDLIGVKGSYHPTDEQRIYVPASVAHVLFVLLSLMALAGAAVLHFHRQDRQLYKLHSCPGSLAHAVSVAATSDLPTVLRSTDTGADMRSVLQEYTFTLNRETGGLVMGDRDPATIPNSPTHLEMTGMGDWMKRRLAQGRGTA